MNTQPRYGDLSHLYNPSLGKPGVSAAPAWVKPALYAAAALLLFAFLRRR